ncbi:MAG: DUF882 domain-containing protein [Alphaproteobacteria bacterium]|nr:DUF882 domain-containing protein [Alphaproteobacteria bacterium]
MTGTPPQRRPLDQSNNTARNPSRRSLFAFAAGACSLLLINKPASAARVLIPEKSLFITRAHAGESFRGVFWAAGQYDPDALTRIKRLLRDANDNSFHQIDTALIELMARMQRTLDTRQALEVVSGYRSPRSNAVARRSDRRVAVNSFHMQGKAVDIRVQGHSLGQLRRAAVSLQAGGVGTYRNRDFLHLDVGPVRTWG